MALSIDEPSRIVQAPFENFWPAIVRFCPLSSQDVAKKHCKSLYRDRYNCKHGQNISLSRSGATRILVRVVEQHLDRLSAFVNNIYCVVYRLIIESSNARAAK